jgi:hypothetical protein
MLTIGTVKTNRKGLPREGIFPKKGPSKKPKDSVKCMRKAGEDVYLTAWQDNKPVHMLSLIKPRLQKICRKSADFGWKKVDIMSHSLITAYNLGMGGTDRMDQMNSYYRFNHKGIWWTHRVVTHFLGVYVINANILYNASGTETTFNTHQFFDEVITSLADLNKTFNWDAMEGENDAELENVPVVLAVPIGQEETDEADVSDGGKKDVDRKIHHRYRVKNCEKKIDRLEGIHIPTILSNKKRRKCVFHPNIKSKYLCETCDAALCLTDCAEKSCWYKFHHLDSWYEK